MSKLSQLQDEFLNALRHKNPALKNAIEGNDQQSSERLKIYQDGYHYRLHNALLQNLPLLSSCLSNDELTELAAAYIQNYPADCYTIQTFANQLPNFLAKYPATAKFDYLIEVAQLDLALLKASRAENQASLSLAMLQQIAAEDWHAISLKLQDNLSLLQFNYNVIAQWQQQNFKSISRLASSQGLLIWRQGLGNRYRLIPAAEQKALNHLYAKEISFANFCELISGDNELDNPAQIMQILNQWLNDEILLAPVLPSIAI